MDTQNFPPPLPNNFLRPEEKLFSKKNMMTFLLVGIFLLVIPFGVKIAKERQIIKSSAAGDPIVVRNGTCTDANNCTTTIPSVQLDLTSPIGPPAPIAGGPLPPGATGAPSGLRANCGKSTVPGASYYTATFNWDAVSNVAGYFLNVYDKDGKSVFTPNSENQVWQQITGGAMNYYTFGLPAVQGNSYRWIISSFDNNKQRSSDVWGPDFTCPSSGKDIPSIGCNLPCPSAGLGDSSGAWICTTDGGINIWRTQSCPTDSTCTQNCDI